MIRAYDDANKDAKVSELKSIEVFVTLRQEQMRRDTEKERATIDDRAAGKKKKKKSSTPGTSCSYCGRANHREDVCYQKHGFPSSHRRRRKKRTPTSTSNAGSLVVLDQRIDGWNCP